MRFWCFLAFYPFCEGQKCAKRTQDNVTSFASAFENYQKAPRVFDAHHISLSLTYDFYEKMERAAAWGPGARRPLGPASLAKTGL